ncbi:MAG: DNA topoisomerase [Clostridia bacterium]|nr:DNA topoisomerase [Clostridia bacterium]
MAKQKATYGNDSISMLKGADRVRKRPGVIFGSDGLDGCEHSVFEILSNSIDEAREGHGRKIIVTRFEDFSVEVEDFGRGIPLDFIPTEQRYNWELVYCELYAGGKYANAEGENYEFSLGTNGLGACATQYSSEYMDVTVYANRTKYTLHFEKGENIGGLTKEPYNGRRTGTIQRWRPDLNVFTDIRIPADYFLDVMKRQSVVNPGVEFVFRNQVGKEFEETVFLYENGISDYVQEMIGDKGLTTVHHWQTERRVRDRDDKPEYKTKIAVALAFSNQVKCTEYYHNSSWLEYGGAPEKAVRSAFVSQIDAWLRQNNKYNKNESRISFADVEDCLVLVTSSFSNVTSYENQTKKSITNKGIQEAMTEFLRRQLEIYFIENPGEAEKIGAQVLINKRSREDAEKTRLNLKKKLSGGLDMTNRVQKFVDCRSRDVSRRELFIVEGDSALGSCKLARDPDFQAIIPLRGKILNCLKADYDKIFKNEVITDLLRVLGCGVEVKSKANKDLASFDLNALRWNKVIICTDADVDGFQIRTLVLTMLYRLTPTLIEAGKVFIAESPLFEITTKKETYFAYTEKEKADFLARIGKEKCTIQRSKGLGENQPEMMSLTTMAPATRRLIQVLPAMAEETAEVFDLLPGDNLTGRKNYIAANGQDYIELADIS